KCKKSRRNPTPRRPMGNSISDRSNRYQRMTPPVDPPTLTQFPALDPFEQILRDAQALRTIGRELELTFSNVEQPDPEVEVGDEDTEEDEDTPPTYEEAMRGCFA